MTTCFTGHRPNKLNGYEAKDNKNLIWEIHSQVVSLIAQGCMTFISGCALGVDTYGALIILKLKQKHPNLKLICAVPCKNQDSRWKIKDKQIYQEILSKADEVIYVSDKEYTNSCMQDRNKYMVDNSNIVLAIWDGTNGGTANCVKYAQQKQKHILIINPQNYANKI